MNLENLILKLRDTKGGIESRVTFLIIITFSTDIVYCQDTKNDFINVNTWI